MVNKCNFTRLSMLDRKCDESCRWYDTCTRRCASEEEIEEMKAATVSCPVCWTKNTGISDSVRTFDNEVYRQRRCKGCGHIFYTMECIIEDSESFKEEWEYYCKCKKKD